MASLGVVDEAEGVEQACRSAIVAVGDRMLVKPDERIATDGIIADGRSALTFRRSRASRCPSRPDLAKRCLADR